MVGKKVQPRDEHWVNFLDLLDIVDLLLAPELKTVAHLPTLVMDHHNRLYPHASVTPKMH